MNIQPSQYTPSQLIHQISIPRYKPSNMQRGQYLYEIDIGTRWAKWRMEKRLADFQDLNSQLTREFNDLPQFPTNYLAMILGESQEDREQYRECLEEYLQSASLRPDIINSQYFSEFLQIPDYAPLMLAKKPKFIGEFQLQQRINDQGKVIKQFYAHPNQQFFVFATGNDSPLQKFNATIANTKFPWEDQEEAEFVLPLGTVQCWVRKKPPFGYQRLWARNYAQQTTKFMFSPSAETMVVGLDDGSIQIFKLHPRGAYYYYEVVRMLTIHEDIITGIFLDQVNKILYTCGADGWLNIIDLVKAVLIDTVQLHSQISAMHADVDNNRLFLTLAEGNVQVYQYDHRAKVKYIHSICTPENGAMKSIAYDDVKKYLFVGGYEDGNVWIYEMGKPGHQKITKQIANFKSKEQLKDLIWIPKKMELISSSQGGQIFFWDALKGKQIYMLKAFQNSQLSQIQYFQHERLLITASKGRLIKFWQIPKAWRDQTAQQEQEREIQIRRKVQNLVKVREAIKAKNYDSDQDDLKFWHIDDSDCEYQYVE